MKLKDMTYEEIELLSYTDLTYILLKENKTSMSTSTIFKKICELLNYDDDYYVEAIGDYYTSLTIDKRFVLLENKEWDIRDHHSIVVTLDDDEEDDDEIIDETDDEELEEESVVENDELDEEFDESLDDTEDIDEEDEDIEFEGLTILQEDELED
ncbi:MAG: DNA-directed RNA polymerase subunit delta [Bacilli bacterium]|nr:DNA-directed RNA polymerase subunit delta [Bacilli bacterium]MDD4282420.1 DNA-directed RNA polymerase subunit delta [Bacilli bacterium]MDD4718454.1 DNA-directed RNA polymerase subunit delta [Bacilli bacterium]